MNETKTIKNIKLLINFNNFIQYIVNKSHVKILISFS
ncbi:hypothetical protein BCF58_2466 [Chryseobacterium defluvii]|uniref:Uncharacterized protein n=1 Tax=Chryseobacterium defluvii TaxID=160396 RepID=A0A495SA63_9FLAO|nr:hypothetical protein BCF58_2466 [Chryseobacterium defluvii]